MRCPVCKAEFVVVEREGVELDWCPFCRGLWFDRGELEALAATLGLPLPPLTGEKGPGSRRCPRCQSPMSTLVLREPPLTLDLCPQNHGLWFDAGELSTLTSAPGAGTPGQVIAFLGEKLRCTP
jgi:Zn-finger nucleic acid-binding protein